MVNLAEIISSTDRYNFHSHTQWCDGRAPIDVMAQAAIDAGMKHWGFSPHSPIPVFSTCNMAADDAAPYIAEVERLRQLHADDITLYTSMEIDYLGPEWGPSHDYFSTLPLDYRMGSVHFVPSPRDGMVDIDGRPAHFAEKMEQNFDRDIRGVVEKFYTQSCRMVEAGGFDIIGHFDKIAYNASCYSPGITDESWYQSLVDNLIDLIVDAGLVVEFNTKALAVDGPIFPDPRHWERLVRSGAVIAVNSDAHFPDKVDAGRPETLALLADLRQRIAAGL